MDFIIKIVFLSILLGWWPFAFKRWAKWHYLLYGSIIIWLFIGCFIVWKDVKNQAEFDRNIRDAVANIESAVDVGNKKVLADGLEKLSKKHSTGSLRKSQEFLSLTAVFSGNGEAEK